MVSLVVIGSRSSVVSSRKNNLFYNKQCAKVNCSRGQLKIFNKLVLKPVGGSKGGAIDLKEGTSSVGAVSPADIIIDVPTVSSQHATLEVKGTAVSVTDTSSTNGTYIDSKKLSANSPQELKIGSEVVFGDEELAKYQLTEEADPMPPPPPPPAETTEGEASA